MPLRVHVHTIETQEMTRECRFEGLFHTSQLEGTPWRWREGCGWPVMTITLSAPSPSAAFQIILRKIPAHTIFWPPHHYALALSWQLKPQGERERGLQRMEVFSLDFKSFSYFSLWGSDVRWSHVILHLCSMFFFLLWGWTKTSCTLLPPLDLIPSIRNHIQDLFKQAPSFSNSCWRLWSFFLPSFLPSFLCPFSFFLFSLSDCSLKLFVLGSLWIFLCCCFFMKFLNFSSSIQHTVLY